MRLPAPLDRGKSMASAGTASQKGTKDSLHDIGAGPEEGPRSDVGFDAAGDLRMASVGFACNILARNKSYKWLVS
jgi:hypothetical protein